MTAAVLKFLEAERAAHPAVANDYAEFADLYHRKLWHQLTVKLERFAAAHAPPSPTAALDDDPTLLPRLYERFVHEFENRVNPLSLVKIAMCVARCLAAPADALALFAPLLERTASATSSSPEAQALALAAAGHYQLALGNMAAVRAALDTCDATLGDMAGLDAAVYAHHFHLSMLFHKAREEAELFYRAGLAHLSYVTLTEVPALEQRNLALDLALAALVGPTIYNIGELLESPVCSRLDDAPETAWLLPVLRAFNSGDIRTFGELLSRAGTLPEAATTVAPLVRHEARLREKICILALMELVFRRPAGDRRLPFAEIAQATNLPLDEVERLAMRALALGLVRGSVDEVERVFEVSWIQPRVLDKAQIETMVAKIDDWSARIAIAIHSLEEGTAQ